MALTDGAAHAVDSSEMAFKLACQYAFREAFMRAGPVILEPVMAVDVRAPSEFQGTIIGDLNRRKGIILNSEGEADDVVMQAQVSPPNALLPSHSIFDASIMVGRSAGSGQPNALCQANPLILFFYHTCFLPGGRLRLQTCCMYRLPKSYPLVDSPDRSKTQPTVGTPT